MNKISIIIPAAGGGKRLGLDYPKELFEIEKGKKLIDFSLKHINDFAENNTDFKVRIVLIITSLKEDIFSYVLSVISSKIEIVKCYFNEEYSEWPGSIYSGKDYYCEKNIVLLPDTYLKYSGDLIQDILKKMDDYNLVFAIKKTDDPGILKNLGAVRFEKGNITEFCDKPQENIEKYNAFWTSMGFRKEIADDLYSFLLKSVRKEKVHIEAGSFYPAAFLEINEFYDLGTWENIENFCNGDCNGDGAHKCTSKSRKR